MKLKKVFGVIILTLTLLLSFSYSAFAETNTVSQQSQTIGINATSKYVEVTKYYAESRWPETIPYNDGLYSGTLTWKTATYLSGDPGVYVVYTGMVYV